MLEISEIIVVEGKNDANKVKSCVKAEVLITSGTHVSKTFLNQLKQASKHREIIVMTDDDYPGRQIRSLLDQEVDGLKHAYVLNNQSRKNTKVGIEHASCEAIIFALQNLVTYKQNQSTLTQEQFYDLGFQGLKHSQTKRDNLCKQLNLPKMNAKRLFHTLNQLSYTYKELLTYANDC